MSDEQQATIYVEDETLRSGFTVIPNGILRHPDLSPGAKLTYMVLLSYAWQQGSCFPGQERMAEDMGAGERSIRRYLKELEAAGFLIIKQRGLGQTNLYILPKHRPANLAGQDRPDLAAQERPNLPPKKDSEEKISFSKRKNKTQSEEERMAQLIQSAREVGTNFEHFFNPPDEQTS
ncbi:MAG TPA: helix-turn-helix domain-containing protein [Herpetosiphonaceae bacterium]|nr:helix-turn-helix domain-containing protein [Herpetosiphonaceae bacterium]